MLKKILKKMVKEKICTKSISLIIAMTLIITSVSSNLAYAMPMVSPVPVVNSLPTSDYIVPFNIGRITDALYSGKSKEIIVNIQDLHSHKQTQRNISNILKILDEKYGIDKVYVEGAIGKVDTSWIKNIEDKNLRNKIVNKLLETGRLTGSELYSIESEKNVLIEGIENKEVYLKNVDRLNEIYNKKVEIEQYLPKIRYILEESVKKYYSKENIKLNKVIKNNKEGKLKASKYFEYIVKESLRLGIDINKYSQVKKFVEIISNQKGFKNEKVKEEISEILKEIKDVLAYKEYKDLVQKVSKKEQETEFYNEVKKISEEKGILSKYPNATKFFNYIQMSEGLNPVELSKEESEIVKEIQKRNSKNIFEKEAYFLKEYIGLVESYLSNKMTAEDYSYFVNNKNRFELLWKKYVDIDGLIDVEKYFNLFEEFYKDNVERNRIFVEKITGKKVAKEIEAIRIKGNVDNKSKIVKDINNGKKIKVVITGGFHTYGFTRLLEDNGIDYCVITPNITEETATAEKLYEDVFKEQYKLQHQTFQKMLVSQVIELLNKGTIIDVKIEDENVVISYENGDKVNLNEIKAKQETETDKKVSKEEAEKLAKIFAESFFEQKKSLKEDREQARKEALEILQRTSAKVESLLAPLEDTINKQYPNDSKKQGILAQLKEDTARMLEKNIRTEEQIIDLLTQFNDILNGKIDEEFMKQRAIKFGTAGARGTMNVANSEGIDDTIDFYTAIIIAQSISDFINSQENMPKTVFLQCDSRYLGTLFNLAMSRVFEANGIQVYMVDNLLGTVATPTGSYFLKDLYENGNAEKYGLPKGTTMAASINVTASHNPGKYNGFKINMYDGAQFPSGMTKEVSSFISDIQSGKTKIKLAKKENVKLIKGTTKEIAGKQIKTELNVTEKAHVEYLIDIFKSVVDLSSIDATKIGLQINGNNSVLVSELKALSEYFGFYYGDIPKDGRDVAYDAKKPEPNEANMEWFATIVANIVIDGKVVFGIASDPDGDRFCIIDSDGKFINPNEIGLIVLNEKLANIQRQIEENKNINTAKQFEDFMGVVLKSHVTSPEIEVLAKKYSDRIYEIAKSRLSAKELSKLDKKIAENNGFFVVEKLPVGWKNIADRQKVIEKAGKKFIAGIESSGGLSLGVYDKDGALATMLPVLIAAKKEMSFKEILSEIHTTTGYASIFSETSVTLDNQGKKDFLDWVNSIKKLDTNSQLEVLKNLLSSLGIDADLAYAVIWENEGLKVAIKDANYASTNIATSFIAFRASGTEPKIRVYAETGDSDLVKEYSELGKKVVNGAYKDVSVETTKVQETRTSETIISEIKDYSVQNKDSVDIRNLFNTDRSAFEKEYDLGNDTKIDFSMARTNIDEKINALLEKLLESLGINEKIDNIIERRAKLYEILLSENNKAIQKLSKISDKIHNNGTKKVVFVMDENDILSAQSALARMHDSRIENGAKIEFVSIENMPSEKEGNTVYICQSSAKNTTNFKFDYNISKITSEIVDTKTDLDILSSILPIMIYAGNDSFKNFIEGAKKLDLNKQFHRDIAKVTYLYRYIYGIQAFTLAPYDNFYENVIDNEQKEYKGVIYILGRVLTDAQHSFFQWIHQGTQKTFIFFIASATTSKEIMKNPSLLKSFKNLLANMIAQADGLAKGQKDTNLHKNFRGNTASVMLIKTQANATSAGAETILFSTNAEIMQSTKNNPILNNIEPIQEKLGTFKGFTETKEFKEIEELNSKNEALSDSVTIEQTITLNGGETITHKTNISKKMAELFNKIWNDLNLSEKALDYIGREIDNEKGGKDLILNRKVNITEDRYVTHWAHSYVLYNKETNRFEAKGKVLVRKESIGSEYFGDGEHYFNEKGEPNPNGEYMDIMAEIIETANKEVEFLENLYKSGIKTVVSFGIGGSDLGPRNFSQILSDYKLPNCPEIRFVHNVDPNDIVENLRDLDPMTTYGIIQSKSFGTAETLSNGELFKSWQKHGFIEGFKQGFKQGLEQVETEQSLKDKEEAIAKSFKDWLENGWKESNAEYPKEELDKFYSKHLAAVSSQANLVSEFGIDTEKNMFPFLSSVGGRYSVFSPVGLPLMLSIGVENFAEALSGEESIYSQLRKDLQDGNIINNPAFIMAIKHIFNINVLGKQIQAIKTDLKGFVAYIQQLRMESNGKSAAVFLKAIANYKKQSKKVEEVTEVAYRTENAVVESSVLGENESPEEVITQENGTEFEFSNNQATSVLTYKKKTPKILGALKALQDLATMICALIWQIIPVDQWGVQLGKVIAKIYHKILMIAKVIAGEVSQITERVLNFILVEQAKKTEAAAKEAVDRDAEAQAEKRDLSSEKSSVQSRPASSADAVDMLALPAQEQAKLEREGFERILNGEVSFAVLAAGDSSRMKASEAGSHIAGMEGKTVLSKAAVPINDKGDSFLSLYIENTLKLIEETKSKARANGLSTEKIKNNTILIMTTAVYKAEQQEIVKNKLAEYGYTDIEIEAGEGKETVTYKNAQGEEIKVEYFNQDKGIVEYATVAQVKAKKNDYKDKKEYVRALYAAAERERAGQKAFEEESAPLGHGEFWHQMVSKGVYADLIGRGNKFVTLRNIDNVAALMNDVLVKEIGSLSTGEEDAYMESSPNAPGLAGGGFVIETDAKGKEAARQYEFQANPIVKQSELFNDAVGVFRLSMVPKIYKAEGESEKAFEKAYGDMVKAGDKEGLQAVSDRGKGRFKTYPATKLTKNKYKVSVPAEITEEMKGYFDEEELGILKEILGTSEEISLWSVKTESSAWGVSCIEVVRTKLISVWNGSNLDKFILDGLKDFSSLTKDVLKHLRFLATKQWTQTEDNLEGIKDKVNAELKKMGVSEDKLIKDISDLRVLLRAESYKWNQDIIQAYVEYVKSGNYLSDNVAPNSIVTTMEKLFNKALISPLEWLQRTSVKLLYGNNLRYTILADTQDNDFKSRVDRAYELSSKGIKVDLVILGKSTLTKELDRQLEVKQKNASVLVHLLKGKEIGNLTTYSYEKIEDTNATKEDIAKAILQEYSAVSEKVRVLDLPANLSTIEGELRSFYTSIQAGKSALYLLVDAYKAIKGTATDSIIEPKTMRAKYRIFNNLDKESIVIDRISDSDIKNLYNQGIKTLMLELSVGYYDKNELNSVLSLASKNKMNVVLSFDMDDFTMDGAYNITETLRQFTGIINGINEKYTGILSSPSFVLNFNNFGGKSEFKYKLIKNFVEKVTEKGFNDIEVKANGYEKEFNTDFPELRQLINYNEAISLINDKDNHIDMHKVVVYIGTDSRENMVINPEQIQSLINVGAILTFDSKVLREISKTATEGITFVDIISAMFKATPEGQKIKGTNIGRKAVLKDGEEFDSNVIEKMYGLLKNETLSTIEKVKELTGKEARTKMEAEGIVEGILEAVELKAVAETEGDIAFANKDDLNKVMELLMQYRMFSGKTYVSNSAEVKKLIDSIPNNLSLTAEELIKVLEDRVISEEKFPNKAIAIAGIIDILLLSKLQDIGINLARDEYAIKNMQAILSAA